MEAVIVATARTPIGRAGKGSLIECRPDDLSADIIQALLAKVPGLDPAEVEDVIWGTAQPAGEAGYNMARVVAILAGLDKTPGTTVNRYCSSSLQTIRMAAHAIKAGEGDVFISGGVETVSRFGNGSSDGLPGTHNPKFAGARERSVARRDGGVPKWTPPEGLPDVYIAMGQTAENVADYCDVTREEMDQFACLSQNRAVESQENGFFEREITPVTTPDGKVVTKDDGPRPGTTLEGLAGLKPVFRPDGRVTAGNACPLNDGAAAVIVMSEERGERARHPAVGADRRQRRDRARPRDHGPRADRGVPPGDGAGRSSPSTTSTSWRSTRRSPRRWCRRPKSSTSRGRSSTCTAAGSRSATRSA